MLALKAENLSKKYRLGTINTGFLFRDLQSWWARKRGQIDPNSSVHSTQEYATRDFWALQDISFEIHQGERIGIIGKNGAGKSTLLKILSRVTAPTRGRVLVRGRFASLLEVGTGFHPELSGRENIFLNGAILGMRIAEIKQKFDQIVDFAGVETFVDTPVKRYSSGMYVRLAFAVAAFLDTDILAIDEVLAVGDLEFQKKCLGKMEDLSTNEGRTILFVSHNLTAVRQLCQQGIVLQKGKVSFQGSAETAILRYTDQVQRKEKALWSHWEHAPGSSNCRLRFIKFCKKDGTEAEFFTVDEEIHIQVGYWNRLANAKLSIHIHILDESGAYLFVSANTPSESSHPDPWYGREFEIGEYITTCKIPSFLLNEGKFGVNVMVFRDDTIVEIPFSEFIPFLVQDNQNHDYKHSKFIGPLHPKLPWETVKQT